MSESNSIYRDFETADPTRWLMTVCGMYKEFQNDTSFADILLRFDVKLRRNDIKPLHLVTLACLIQYLNFKGHKVFYSGHNDDLKQYIMYDLNFSAYWSGGQNHVEANSSNIFNLWRIEEKEKDLYAKNVEQFFTRNYFEGKDLSGLSVSLVEAFYNVFDHASANGNAFSIISYDDETKVLSYAVADFGIGIPTSVRRFKPEINSDIEALEWSITDNSTVRSTKRNKGYGMKNIIGVADFARIFSNNALMFYHANSSEFHEVDFQFPGTLIYLDIDMTSFEEEEVMESLVL